jgi:hypothetical protein
MRMRLLTGLTLMSLALTLSACRPDDRDHTVPPRADRSDEPISVAGCLTAGPEQQKFVLTAESTPLTSMAVRATGTATTFTYELVGGENLARYLGQRVTVHGRVDEEQDSAEFAREREAPVDSATPQGDTPTVTSTEVVEIEVRRLFIESVVPSSESCVAG